MLASRDLPIDLINIILSGLPAKSLLRFRCVCKSWRDYISSPEFIKLHRDIKLHTHVLIQDGSICSVHCDETFVEQARFLLPCLIVWTHGYSNGLVCLSTFHGESDLHLWNPSIRKFKTLPRPLLTMNCCDSKVAFCFVPRINDYRLLRTVNNFHPNEGAKSEIYSLHTNSWKLVGNMPFYEILDSSVSSAVNGVIYILAIETQSSLDEVIILFDMADEVFTTIKIRAVILDFNADSDTQFVYPIFFGASLYLIHVFYMDNHYMVDVWERKVHDDATESWTKEYKIDDWLRPLGFLMNGEMVCRHGNGHIISYDPTRIPEIKGPPIARISQRVNINTYFVETLMLLDEENYFSHRPL